MKLSFLEGEMGKYAVVARRSGSDWYVSMLNAGDKKQISLPLDFLKNKKNYTAHTLLSGFRA